MLIIIIIWTQYNEKIGFKKLFDVFIHDEIKIQYWEKSSLEHSKYLENYFN